MSNNQKAEKESEKDVKVKVPPKFQKSKPYLNNCERTLLATNIILVVVVAYFGKTIYRDKSMSTEEPFYYTDCGAYFRLGERKNGVYEIQPTADIKSRFNVYCDMEKGGWTVIMKRDINLMNDMSFKRSLQNYATGFGNLEQNHWLGLDRIHLLTLTKKRDMMFIIDKDQYQVHDFRVLGPDDHYKLVVMQDIDVMPHDASFTKLNNTYFSAGDVDFDLAEGKCSEAWDGGWWFTNCFDKSVCMTGRGLHNSVGVTKFTYSMMLIK